MPKLNPGFQFEKDFVAALDGHLVKDLPNNLHYNIKEMFSDAKEDDIIHCERVDGFKKPDVLIRIRNKTYYVSLKSGRSRSVHQEDIKNFVIFLRSFGISNRTLRTILLVHYGDGTIDGTGTHRMSYTEVMYKYQKNIDEANKELNSNPEFIKAVIERCVLKGTDPENISVDYIYDGDLDYGILVSAVQLRKHIERKDWNYLNNLHIGPVLFRPHARYVNKKEVHPEGRHKVEVEWPNFEADLRYISKRYEG